MSRKYFTRNILSVRQTAQLRTVTSSIGSCSWPRNMEARSGKILTVSVASGKSINSTGKDNMLVGNRRMWPQLCSAGVNTAAEKIKHAHEFWWKEHQGDTSSSSETANTTFSRVSPWISKNLLTVPARKKTKYSYQNRRRNLHTRQVSQETSQCSAE